MKIMLRIFGVFLLLIGLLCITIEVRELIHGFDFVGGSFILAFFGLISIFFGIGILFFPRKFVSKKLTYGSTSVLPKTGKDWIIFFIVVCISLVWITSLNKSFNKNEKYCADNFGENSTAYYEGYKNKVFHGTCECKQDGYWFSEQTHTCVPLENICKENNIETKTVVEKEHKDYNRYLECSATDGSVTEIEGSLENGNYPYYFHK